MNSDSVIVQALAAGAVAVFRPHNTIEHEDRALDRQYMSLKLRLRESYPQVDPDILDIGPVSEERQTLLENQLRQSGALDDEALQEDARALLEEIFAHEPQAAMAVGLINPQDPQ